MTHHAAQQQALAACEQGAMCIDDRPGHAVTLMHLRLAHLHPDGWVDSIVEGVDEDGTVSLRRWSDGTEARVWHHTNSRDLLAPGSAVSVHERYGVLAAGEHRLNVALR